MYRNYLIVAIRNLLRDKVHENPQYAPSFGRGCVLLLMEMEFSPSGNSCILNQEETMQRRKISSVMSYLQCRII